MNEDSALYLGVNNLKQRKKTRFRLLPVLLLLQNCTQVKASTGRKLWAGFKQWIIGKDAKIIKQEYLLPPSSLTVDVDHTIIW